MAGKTLLLLGATLLHLQSALAVPMANDLPAPINRRVNITVDPPRNITPIITEIEDLTEQGLEDLISLLDGDNSKSSKRVSEAEAAELVSRTEPLGLGERASEAKPNEFFSRTKALAPRETGTDGALLTFIYGFDLPNDTSSTNNCEDFVIDGPFTMIHLTMGTSTVRGVVATSMNGNTTSVIGNASVEDPGEFEFAANERITKFSVGVDPDVPSVSAVKFETDGGNSYDASSRTVAEGKFTPTYQDLDVGSGIIARIRGTNCQNTLGVLGSLGIDFLDELDSIAITNIDYDGFTNDIMPSGKGTQMSVGSQVLDNRNSSVQQQITLTTTDAVTQERAVNTEILAMVGGSVAIEAGAGIPFLSQGKVTTSANWQIQTSSVSFPRFFQCFFPGLGREAAR